MDGSDSLDWPGKEKRVEGHTIISGDFVLIWKVNRDWPGSWEDRVDSHNVSSGDFVYFQQWPRVSLDSIYIYIYCWYSV